ncbi:MAG TPA: hypothetical protein DD491_06960, partial [Halieaceae bacterium]|nr:hypothetical protein [Halieaceae bacterium]
MAFDTGDSDTPSRLVMRLRQGLIGVNPVTGVRGLNQDAAEVVGVTVAKPTRYPQAAPKPSSRIRVKPEAPAAGDKSA